MIAFEQVSKIFPCHPPIQALRHINLHIHAGERFGIVGLSGAGKSTLIRCINKLEVPTEGTVRIHGVNLAELSEKALRQQRKKIGMIFQHFNLLASKTVYDNVAMPLYLEGKSKREVQSKVMEILEFVGLCGKEHVYPEQLSGGQKQRVGIARALVTDPDILLCDEATSALDPETTKTILELLHRVNRKYGITLVLITHEMGVIRDLCTSVAVMDNGEILEQGSVYEVFSNPQHPITKKFIGTVVQQELPESQLFYHHADTPHQLYRLIFKGEQAVRPLLSEVSKQFDVHLNILYGSIMELQSRPYGNLLVALEGEQEERARTLAFLADVGIDIKEVTE